MGVNSLVSGAFIAGAFAAGSGAGYFLARKHLQLKYEELAKREISEAKNFYAVLHKKEYDTPEKAVEALVPLDDGGNEFTNSSRTKAVSALQTYSGQIDLEKITRGRVNVETMNVFVDAELKPGTDEDWAKELRNRTEEAPYILSKLEFMQNETDYTQITCTYYEGDQTLTDDRDDVVEEPDELVGLYNLKRFGHWSEDARVVYVRNDVKQLEVEVVLHNGTYGEMVAGFGGGNE